MSDSTTQDLTNVSLAIVLGVLGNVLLNNAAWGINATLWLFTTFSVVQYLRRQNSFPKLARTVWVAYAFSLLFLWRDSATLQWLALGSIIAAISFASLGRRTTPPTLLAYFGVLIDTLGTMPILIKSRVPAAAHSVSRTDIIRAPIVERILRGLLLSLVPVAIFGWLFFAADAAFESLVIDFVAFDPMELGRALLFVTAYGLVACAILYVLTTGPLTHIEEPPLNAPKAFGSVEIIVVLSVINVLFGVFVYLQLGYLFGGHAHVLDEQGPTYANYAQRGFYELCAIAALAFSMLLALKAYMPIKERKAYRIFVGLSQLHILFVAVIVASSFHRIALYIGEYGLTEQRFYAMAATAWLIIPLSGLAVALFRVKSTFLPTLIVHSAFVAVLVLFTINPDGLIARANIQHAMRGHVLDAPYAASLSADAVPTLVQGLSLLSEGDQQALREELSKRWPSAIQSDFREFNLARFLAARSLRDRS